MRKHFVVLIALTVAINIAAYADDIIMLIDGDAIRALVKEVGVKEVKYKKSSNPQGPVYVVEKEKIFSIKYDNGEVEKFSANNNVKPTDKEVSEDASNPSTLKLPASEENARLLDWHNTPFFVL